MTQVNRDSSEKKLKVESAVTESGVEIKMESGAEKWIRRLSPRKYNGRRQEAVVLTAQEVALLEDLTGIDPTDSVVASGAQGRSFQVIINKDGYIEKLEKLATIEKIEKIEKLADTNSNTDALSQMGSPKNKNRNKNRDKHIDFWQRMNILVTKTDQQEVIAFQVFRLN